MSTVAGLLRGVFGKDIMKVILSYLEEDPVLYLKPLCKELSTELYGVYRINGAYVIAKHKHCWIDDNWSAICNLKKLDWSVIIGRKEFKSHYSGRDNCHLTLKVGKIEIHDEIKRRCQQL